MILSNSAIFTALDEKRLVIDPEPEPRNPADDPDADWPYGTSAIDLRLGDEVSWFNDGLAVNIDLRRGKFAKRCGRSFEGQVIALLRRHYGEDVDIAPSPVEILGLAAASVADIPAADVRSIARKLRERER